MKMSKIGYFSEFLLFPPLVLVATFLTFRDPGRPPLVTWIMVFCAGLAGWTLIEYLLHRLLFHHLPILSRIHEQHHNSPEDLIGTPAWASASIALIAVATPAVAMLGFDLGTAATAGMAAGYLWYVLIHYTQGLVSISGAAESRSSPLCFRSGQFWRYDRLLGSSLRHSNRKKDSGAYRMIAGYAPSSHTPL